MEIKGTSGNDDGDKSLISTSDSDIIHGLEGNDNIVLSDRPSLSASDFSIQA